ncbi:MAG: CDP-alcohol phosphatidyltransferase family protein [Deltaproteobacteria bacterium]|nr:CDP-alcohol phosphatidyltransferase family protein [Deltaproteobacteria bacterium]
MQVVIVAGTDTILVGGEDRLIADVLVGGLSLLGRAIRAAQIAGADRVLVVGPDRLREAALRDRWLRVPVEWRACELPFARSVEALVGAKDALEPRFSAACADRVLSPALLPLGARDGDDCLVAVESDTSPVSVIGCSTEVLERRRDLSLDAAARDLLATGAGRALPVSAHTPALRIRSDEERRAAHRRLFAGLKKPLGHDADGIVAYYLNRRISSWMSRALVHTPVTPNQVSAIAMILGLVAAALAATGVWAWMVAAGVILQSASVIDGVDGEIARLKLCMSKSGEWFDTVCDDVTSIAFFAGVGHACHLRGAPWALASTVVGAASWIALDALLYRDLLRAGHASHNQNPWVPPSGRLSRAVVLAIAYAGKRDLYTLILLVLLVLDLPAAAFAMMLAGVVAALAALVLEKLRSHS